MEIKNTLTKPYTDIQKAKFIIDNVGCEFKETDESFEAWGYTEKELLQQAKGAKYIEADTKAKAYLNGGNALFEYKEGENIEATDGNIGKMIGYLLDLAKSEVLKDTEGDITKILENLAKLLSGQISGVTNEWRTKEDKVIEINILQVLQILKGLQAIQSQVWNEKYGAYLTAIKNAKTIKKVNEIVIDYGE